MNQQWALEKQPVAPLRIVAVNGSLRPGSHTRAALQVALEGARRAGAEVEMLDLTDFDLPFCDGADPQAEARPNVLRFRQRLAAADGVLLGTPEYHGGMSGVLKNALDLVTARELQGKPLGLVSVAGGAMGGFAALTTLREIGRSLHAWVVPEQASLPAAWGLFDEQGELRDKSWRARLQRVGAEVAEFAARLPQRVAA